MKIVYKFVTGEKVRIDVKGELEASILEINYDQGLVNRKENRRHESLDFFDKNPQNKDKTANIYGQVLKQLTKDKLYSAISKLKPAEQDLVREIYLAKKAISQEDYAKKLNVPSATIRKRVERIRKKLEKLLKQQFLGHLGLFRDGHFSFLKKFLISMCQV